MKRFFAFGCSFTKYEWVTWADIISHSLHLQGYQCYNYGIGGAGNELIFKSIVAADLKHKFTEDDIIMVLWSSWSREDRYHSEPVCPLGTYWTAVGNVYNQGLFDDSFVSKHVNHDNDIIKNICSIQGAKKYANLNFEGVWGTPFEYASEDITEQISFSDYYAKRRMNETEDKISCDCRSNVTITINDPHPCVHNHLFYIKNKIKPLAENIPKSVNLLLPESEQWALDLFYSTNTVFEEQDDSESCGAFSHKHHDDTVMEFITFAIELWPEGSKSSSELLKLFNNTLR